MKSIFNKGIVAIRGAFYVLFYQLRKKPKLWLQLKKNKNPIITVKAGNISFPMVIDLLDGGLSQDIYNSRVREYPNVLFFEKFLKKYAKDIDTIIEVGANLGYYLLLSHYVFKRIKKKVTIVGIEPVMQNFNFLKKNIELSEIKDVIPLNIAMGDKNTKIKMIVPKERNLSHMEGIDNVSTIKSYDTQQVSMYTLDKLLEETKITQSNILFRWDIEGYEYNLIKGNRKMFQSLKNIFIIMEFHPQLLKKKKTIEFLELLKDIGFKLEYTVSCYPLYFFDGVPGFITKFLNKLWVLEKGGEELGLLKKYSSLDDLIKEFMNDDSSLYSHPNLHLYLVKS